MPPVIQMAEDVDPQILQLQLQAQENVSEVIAIPAANATIDEGGAPKKIVISKKGKKDPEIFSSARTSGSAAADGSNVSFPAYLFEAVPKQLKVEELRKKLLIEQIKYTKNCNSFIDKLNTVVGPIKYFLSNMPKLSASSTVNNDHSYQYCEDQEGNDVSV